MDGEKSFRQLAKEAKARMKTGFWEKHYKEVDQKIKTADENGLNKTKVAEYFQNKVASTIKGQKGEDELFYQKVKEILDKTGETSDILGRLTDKDYFDSLSYEQKQRYSMELSQKYRKALERYKNEMRYENTNE